RASSTNTSLVHATTTACSGPSSPSRSGASSTSATASRSSGGVDRPHDGANRVTFRPRAIAYWALRAAVSAAVLAYISYDVDHAHLRATLSAVHVETLVLPLSLYLAGQLLSAVKWWLLGRSVGLVRPLVEYVRFYFIGMFLNVFGPSTIGGDVARGLYLSDGRQPALALASGGVGRVRGLAVRSDLG